MTMILRQGIFKFLSIFLYDSEIIIIFANTKKQDMDETQKAWEELK